MDVKLVIHILQTHTVASRHSTVAAVLENVETIGVVNAGSTLQMLQVEIVTLLHGVPIENLRILLYYALLL